ncbi:Endonuclease/exonuclease/phosphatase [Flagelloscypha sp. PMI_526]|nr:Endonuclease/exonuclease/phosphatase [Flagelloscypha sp. PMI_526]
MPPRRASKRKVEDEDFAEASSSKKLKTDLTESQQAESEGGHPADTAPGFSANGQPTNKTPPQNISFPERSPGSFRISAYNICGWAPAHKRGFKAYYEAENADILVLSETKVNDAPLEPAISALYPYRYWSISGTKTYAGVGILSKKEPLSVSKTLPGHPNPETVKGRIITLEFEHAYIIGTYVVNAGQGLKTLDKKKQWQEHFEPYIRELDKKKPVIWCGDLNVAPTAIDLANPKQNWNKGPGYTEAETTSYKNILNPPEDAPDGSGKFVDVWRDRHPDTRHYTYFSYRFNARQKGLGWRLDMFVLSERLKESVKMCEIRDEIWGISDHCPLVLEIDENAL